MSKLVDQSKKQSLVESLVNIGVGFGLSMVSNILILGLYGIHIGLHTQFVLTLWFTGISITRSYLLRRLFNYIGRKRFEHSNQTV